MGLVLNPFTGTFDFTGSGGSTPTTPGGAVNSVQFNDAGAFGGFGSWDGTTLDIPGVITQTLTLSGADVALDQRLTVPDVASAFKVGVNSYILSTAATNNPTAITAVQGSAESSIGAGRTMGSATGGNFSFSTFGAGTTTTGDAIYWQTYVASPAIVTTVNGLEGWLYGETGATIGTQYGYTLFNALNAPTITTLYGIWQDAFGGKATNVYSFWSDEQGVFRIRADNTFNSVYQAIPALYNPQFTKYTAGATNFERVVLQWESNVATLTTEKGGTGTLRALNLGDTNVAVTVNSIPVVTTTGTQTLTNKRITKRVVTASDATSITPNSDNADVTTQTNTQATGNLTINADTGTPTNAQSWLLKIKSTNVQTFVWNSQFEGGANVLPTATTGGGLIDAYAFLWDSIGSHWLYTGGAGGFA